MSTAPFKATPDSQQPQESLAKHLCLSSDFFNVLANSNLTITRSFCYFDFMIEKKSDFHFSYPPNLHELDLATLVSMYRDRGLPRKARAGEYFACAVTRRLVKDAKWWFGQYYSQKAWDDLLTKGSEGYPLTDVELNVLGMVLDAGDEPVRREYVEEHSGAVSRLAYMIVNDLKEFGFLSVDGDRLFITPRGEKALQGLAKRMYDRRFTPEMLQVHQDGRSHPPYERARKKKDDEQASLF